ncbi:unnamed protein product [Fraxinus pennsylvanica]|uniref:HMA domain-containing protein n=1 Tax=Fraxinus pennsylvanica TaxID=56036 RepID=A0AAD1Z7Y2_9LAMI|nr:unnamed protein product [Fraxinus pennsylvanica]
MSTKKTELKVTINCEKCKTEVLKAVAKLTGVDSVAVTADEGTVTVVGTVDPVCVITAIRKTGKFSEITSVGPPKKPDPEPDLPEPCPSLPACCVDSVAVTADKGTVTVVGTVDPVCVITAIRKTGKFSEITSVGPPKKPDPPKPDPPKPCPPLPACCKQCQLVGVSYVTYDSAPCSIL